MSNPATEYRIEHDTMGEVRVPASALYRAQTQRAVENFPISGTGLEAAQIVALARIKRAAAIVNGRRGIIGDDVAKAIVAAADTIIGGAHHDQFPVDTYQTGSGTSSNMNMNEVLSTLARRNIPLAPTPHIQELFFECAQASLDAEPFPVARNFARVMVSFTTADILVGLIRSLEDEPENAIALRDIATASMVNNKIELFATATNSSRTSPPPFIARIPTTLPSACTWWPTSRICTSASGSRWWSSWTIPGTRI